MTDEPTPKTEPSPFAGLDYPTAPERCDAVGRLALSVRELTGVGGLDALAAAALIDQGRMSEALDLLAAAAADKAAEADERKRRAQEKAAAR